MISNFKQHGRIQVIATQVPASAKAKLSRLASEWGMSLNALQQVLFLALVRSFDDARTPLTPEHDAMLRPFLTASADRIDGALLFLYRPKAAKPQLLSVLRRADGAFVESLNADHMLIDFLKVTDPTTAKALQRKTARHGHFSPLAFIHDLIIREEDDERPSYMATGDGETQKREPHLRLYTKIPVETRLTLIRIAAQWGTNVYHLQQALLLAFARTCDPSATANAQLQIMTKTFLTTISTTANSFDPLANLHASQERADRALLFLHASPTLRPQLLSVARREDGAIVESRDHDEMFLAFLSAADPQAANALQREARAAQRSPLAHLRDIIMASRPSFDERMKADIDELFNDIRIPTGEAVNDNVFYKRRHRQGDYSSIIEIRPTIHADL